MAIHLAPACGTSSKAREKKLWNFRNKGFKVPGPLRSKAKPMGLDSPAGLDKIRTESANIVSFSHCNHHQVLHSEPFSVLVGKTQRTLFAGTTPK